MLYSCPNDELSENIIQNFYARLSHDDRTMLDTSCTSSFMKRDIDFKWNLLERNKRNSEDWELEEGKESGMNSRLIALNPLLKQIALVILALSMDLTLRE